MSGQGEGARPFEDVVFEDGGFSLPQLKWRELLFIGALRPTEEGLFERDPARVCPPFRAGDLFAVGRRYLAAPRGTRVLVREAGAGNHV